MPLRETGRIPLPAHSSEGGFDHAAVHRATARLYVAHTANDVVEVVDVRGRNFVRSLSPFKGVAGVWVSQESGLLFTSNRGEDSVSIFRLPEEQEIHRLPTGVRPNGMAFDPRRQILLVAGVGNPDTGTPPTATFIDVGAGRQLSQTILPGRTRWATYHDAADAFFVNIRDPPCIAQIEAQDPSQVGFIGIPATGPHGLEQDSDGRILYCACDDGNLVTVDIPSRTARVVGSLAGPPDVIWLNARLQHLYVAIGEPGVVQVFGTHPCRLLETIPSGPGAHTLTLDSEADEVHVFLPESHEALVLRDDPSG